VAQVVEHLPSVHEALGLIHQNKIHFLPDIAGAQDVLGLAQEGRE
jgi:hypothetical protein